MCRCIAISALLFACCASTAFAGASPDEAARVAIRTKQFAHAVQLLHGAAEAGDAQSQYLLGLASASGIGTQESHSAAVHWLTRASEQSHREAALALAGLLAGDAAGEKALATRWLMRAAELGHPRARMLRELQQLPLATAKPVEAAADGHEDQFGTTALMRAAAGESPAVLDAVLRSRPQLEAQDPGGNTALMYAVRWGSLDHVHRLIGAGANVNAPNADDWLPLDLARRADRQDIIAALREAGARARSQPAHSSGSGIDPARGGEMYRGWPAIAVAASRDDAGQVASLLGAGSRPDERTPQNDTPLLVAARSGAAHVVEPLVRAGANVEFRHGRGSTALVLAARRGDLAFVDAMLSAGVSPAVRASDEDTALHAATLARNAPLIQRLRTAGADVAATDAEGLTPIMIAARVGDASLLRPMLGLPQALERKDRSGRTALWYAAVGGNTDTIATLLAAGASFDDTQAATSPLFAAIGADNERAVELLLSKRAPVNPRAGAQTTPLMAAADRGSAQMVRALLAAGAEMNRQDAAGDTALMIAARAGHIEVCRALLRAGADARLRNNDRMSALDIARRRHFTDLIAVLDAPG